MPTDEAMGGARSDMITKGKTMKGRIFTYMLAAALLWVAGCAKEDDPVQTKGDDAGRVTLEFSVEMPELQAVTKGELKGRPQVEDIHVAMFGTAGYLEEYVLAEPIGKAEENTTKYTYKVSLPVYDGKCSLHFIANGPGTLDFGNEAQVISELKTSLSDSKPDAYWQRYSLDYIPSKITSGFLTESGLDDVAFVRNFSRLKVDASGCKDFVLEGFLLVNEPTSGSVAPYTSGDPCFMDKYLWYGASDYGTLEDLEDRYEGFTPASAKRHSFSENDVFIDGNGDDGYAYFYEVSREAASGSIPYVLVKGKYGDSEASSYYKMLLVDTEGNPMTFLRNFSYTISIVEVKKNGSETAAKANETSGTDNFDIISSVTDINEVSDGDVALELDYRTKVLAADGTTASLGFTFRVKDGENGYIYPLECVSVEAVSPVDGEYNILSDVKVATDNSETGGEITYKVSGLGSFIKSQRFKVTAKYVTHKISLTVTVYLLPVQKMVLTMEPTAVNKVAGEKVTAWLQIPLGLPSSIFPLHFSLESAGKTLSPASGANLPVETGKSIVKGQKGDNSYQFVRTLGLDEYNGLSAEGKTYTDADGAEWVRFASDFVTVKAESATTVYASSQYFTSLVSASFANYTFGSFTELAFGGDSYASGKVSVGQDKSLTFSFSTTVPDGIAAAGPLMVTLVGLEPDEGETVLEVSGKTDSDGNIIYSYADGTNAGSHNLKLRTTTDNGPVEVRLDCDLFTSASLSSQRSDMLDWAFHGFSEKSENGSSYYYEDKAYGNNKYGGDYVGFTKDAEFVYDRNSDGNHPIAYHRIKLGVRTVRYNFSYADSKLGDPVTVVVTNGELVSSGVTNLGTAISSTGIISEGKKLADGSMQYTFTPNSTTEADQTFIVRTSFAEAVAVSISASGYVSAEDAMSRAFYAGYNVFIAGKTPFADGLYGVQLFFQVADYISSGDSRRSIVFTTDRTYYGKVGNYPSKFNQESAMDLDGISDLNRESWLYLQCYNGNEACYNGSFWEGKCQLYKLVDATIDNQVAMDFEKVSS